MPRGSNSSIEQERISSSELSKERSEGKSGIDTGPKGAPFVKRGYGRDSMQANPGKMKKPSF